MPDTSWTNNPKLNHIDPRKMTIFLELMKEAEGKPMEQLVPLLMNANKKLQQQNMAFSKDESDVLMEILTKNLSPKERQQFEMIRKFMATRK
ncbi:MAG TPA: hypothetical protein GXX75_25560 [Clostridiales bacterium]|nr:hypothetical protein [Clostridiales bacterium]